MTEGRLRLIRDGSSLVRVRGEQYFRVSVGSVWTALSDPDWLARWFAPMVGDLREGSQLTVQFEPNEFAEAKVTMCRPGIHILLSWRIRDFIASTVTIYIRASGQGCILRLVQDIQYAESANYHLPLWQHYLDRLADLLDQETPPDWISSFEAIVADLDIDTTD